MWQDESKVRKTMLWMSAFRLISDKRGNEMKPEYPPEGQDVLIDMGTWIAVGFWGTDYDSWSEKEERHTENCWHISFTRHKLKTPPVRWMRLPQFGE